MKTRLLVTVAMLVAAALVGCTGCSGGGPDASKTIEVPMDDVLNQSTITRDITLLVRDTLKVSLGSNHTTPYRWTPDPKIGDATILKQTRHVFVRPHNGRTGAPGTETWMYSASKAGATTIVAQYGNIVGGDTTPACTFTAKVTVQ